MSSVYVVLSTRILPRTMDLPGKSAATKRPKSPPLGDQVGSVVSFLAFHLQGSRSEKSPQTGALHMDWGFQSIPKCVGNSFGVFHSHLSHVHAVIGMNSTVVPTWCSEVNKF